MRWLEYGHVDGGHVTVIGLTGGIASGKSTVANYFSSLGHKVIDADLLGHLAYEPDTQCYARVVEEFGTEIVATDRTIDRRKLGAKVFGDSRALKRLTDIVWPEIKKLAKVEIDQAKSGEPGRLVVLEAAVLIEAEWQDIVDEIWVVTVDKETAISRATSRDGATREAVESRIASQISNEDRLQMADVNIPNNSIENDLYQTLDREISSLNQRRAQA
ncbi:MAG: dephospho-CoA kinase [Gammaproteobacteria bacterium]|nr:dephospho-CoA kinase [Gammaproteobacteria bacterium]